MRISQQRARFKVNWQSAFNELPTLPGIRAAIDTAVRGEYDQFAAIAYG